MTGVDRHFREAATAFRTTDWASILNAKNDFGTTAETRGKFCEAYWPPIYSYLRRAGYSSADAQDLTQDFFYHLLRSQFLEKIHEPRGKFRTFLLTCLKNHLAHIREKNSARKRGGGSLTLSLENLDQEERYALECRQITPDQAFDRRWAQAVLARALASLGDSYRRENQADLFAALRNIDPASAEQKSYAEIAAHLRLSPSAVKAAAYRFRVRYRQTLRQIIGETVGSRREVEEEIRALMISLGG